MSPGVSLPDPVGLRHRVDKCGELDKRVYRRAQKSRGGLWKGPTPASFRCKRFYTCDRKPLVIGFCHLCYLGLYDDLEGNPKLPRKEPKDMSHAKAALRFSFLAMLVGFLPHVVMSQGNSTSDPNNILFILQDKLTRFDQSGSGLHVGTAMGKVNGVSTTVVRFDFSAFPNFSFNNRTGISDTDGDQIIFKVVGSGRFLVPPLVDPTVPGDVTAPPSQVLGGLGGPLSGTYEVVATSGKYSKKFSLGQKFPFKAVGYNPNPASVGTDPLGAVYIEVFAH
jgi:hypothetical protein